jgi:hypothetical protein
MSTNDKILYIVRYLLSKSLDGVITEEEIRRLDRLIIENPDARAYYVEYLQIHAHLRKLLQHNPESEPSEENMILDAQLWEQLARHEQTAELVVVERAQPPAEEQVEKPAAVSPRQKVNKFSLYAAVSAAAAFILLLAYVHLSPMIFKPVAVVADQIQGAVLFQSSIPYVDPELYPGSYTMEKGLIELVFMDGGKVVIEAPSEFVIENASRIYLLKGQLTALVENKRKPFVVRTLNSNIIDLGTEFGVRANADGTMETHVFQGKVRLESNEQPKQAALMLESGQAARADSGGILTRREADPLQFVCLEEFSIKKQAAKGSAYCRWQEQVYQIHRDPALVAHYTFKQDSRHPDQLKNQAPGTRGQLDGILEGQKSKPQWSAGRWAEKTALFFDRSATQRVRIPADWKLCMTGPITLGAWIKTEKAPEGFVPGMRGGNILSNGKDEEKINYHLSYGLYYESHMMIYMRAQGFDFHTRGPATDLTADQWHFLSVTHDNYQVCFYIDGKLMKTVEKSFAGSPVFADLLIGGMEPLEQPKYRFHGFIDEVLIFNRVLSEPEMQVLYESGKP